MSLFIMGWKKVDVLEGIKAVAQENDDLPVGNNCGNIPLLIMESMGWQVWNLAVLC